MAVESLSRAALDAALVQLTASEGFRPANRHLSAAQIAGIAVGQWPNVPVFTPYANTHHGYSQSKVLPSPSPQIVRLLGSPLTVLTFIVRLSGTKYLTHRVTYQQFFGDLQRRMDISHILYLGKNTARYVEIRKMFSRTRSG